VTEQSKVAELYEKHGHALYRRSYRLLGNEEEAREVLQETFCQFWRDRARFAGRSSFFTYLYRITTNLSIDRLRRRTRVGIHYGFEEGRDGRDGSVSPEEQVMAAAEVAVLTEGMDSKVLTVGVLARVDGYTQEEIGVLLGVSRRTVGKRLKSFTDKIEKRRKALKRDAKRGLLKGASDV